MTNTPRSLVRARLRSELLSSVPMMDGGEASAVLGSQDALSEHEAQARILRVAQAAEVLYPRFQFDIPRHRLHPAMLELMGMRTDNWGSHMALLHWLTRPNRSLGGARPSDRLATDGDAILRSFAAELAQPLT
ncbi:antitoxin Xre/MbcA/ParS toxin-binding domain-containing protein [Tranquillimonas alkanivorans]|uniref:Uncharacterized protein n=1 Tax=Tranquillimonas alkanivorans TaxID=441119 RepID=A0A1I5WC89_9RHOB|nr:antitoxin Xre/MbcA/ParS toxin-binding domain-containing protein [Tranquillimonas alkanivorans]SFQ17311.1 Protein of unknown function [Tranquillimonas alkanivorans]